MNSVKNGMSESEAIQYVKKLTDGYMKDGRLNVYDKKTLSFLRSFLKKHYKHIDVVSINNADKWLLMFTGSLDKKKKELLDKNTNESLIESFEEYMSIKADKNSIIDWITKQGQKVISDIEEKFGESLSQISMEDIIEYISTDNVLWKNFKHKFSVKDVAITTEHSEEKTTMTEQLTESMMSKELWCDVPDVYLIRYDNNTPAVLEYEGNFFDFDTVDAKMWDIYMDEWNADIDHNFLIPEKDEGYEDFVKYNADTVYNILDDLADSGEYATVEEVEETSKEEPVEQPEEEVQIEEVKKSKKSLNDILSEAIEEACKSKDKKEVMEQLKKFLEEDFTRDPKINNAIQDTVNEVAKELDDKFNNFEDKEITAYCLSTCGNRLMRQLNDLAGDHLKKKFYGESLNEDQGEVSYNGKSVTYEDIYEELYYVIDHYFRTLQDRLGITSGDISPEDTLHLDDIREELALCVMDVLRSETGDYTIDESLNEENAEQNPLSNLRPGIYPMFQFPNGDYVHVGYENGKLFAGGATNAGIFHEYEIDYDWDSDLDVNLQNLYDLIIETKPELNDETALESLHEDVENNSEEDDEELYRVIMRQGSVRLIYEKNLSKEDALEIIDDYSGRWYDENGGEWKLTVETMDGDPIDDSLGGGFYFDEPLDLTEDTEDYRNDPKKYYKEYLDKHPEKHLDITGTVTVKDPRFNEALSIIKQILHADASVPYSSSPYASDPKCIEILADFDREAHKEINKELSKLNLLLTRSCVYGRNLCSLVDTDYKDYSDCLWYQGMKEASLVESYTALSEDTVKIKDHKWVNKGEEGTHGEFKTKKEADAQRKAMFANGYHEDLNESDAEQGVRPFSELDAIATAYYDDNDFKSFSSFSDEELAVLWANCLYTDANPWGQPYDDEVYETIASLPNSEEIFDKAKEISKDFGDLTEDFEEEEWPDEEIATCDFCGEDVPVSELSDTDYGRLCDYCIQEIESRGEPIAIYKNKYESLEEDGKLDLTYPDIQLDDVPEGVSADDLEEDDENALDNFKLLSDELNGKITKAEEKYIDGLTQSARILTDGERFEYNDWYEDTVYASADDFIKWIDYNIIQNNLNSQDESNEELRVSDDSVFEFLEAVDSDIDSDEQKVADIMDTFDITEEEAKEYLKKYQEK